MDGWMLDGWLAAWIDAAWRHIDIANGCVERCIDGKNKLMYAGW